MKFWLKIIALIVILILISIWAKPVIADDTNTQTDMKVLPRITMTDRQTRQHQRQQIQQLPMGQMYPLHQLTHLPIRACLKTFALWVLVVLLVLGSLAFLGASM